MKLSYLIILSIIITFSIGADYAFAANDVPDWIKNNAMWWAEGKITEEEYMTALQYLADEGIL